MRLYLSLLLAHPSKAGLTIMELGQPDMEGGCHPGSCRLMLASLLLSQGAQRPMVCLLALPFPSFAHSARQRKMQTAAAPGCSKAQSLRKGRAEAATSTWFFLFNFQDKSVLN